VATQSLRTHAPTFGLQWQTSELDLPYLTRWLHRDSFAFYFITYFPIRYSSCILLFDTIYSELLTASWNIPYINRIMFFRDVMPCSLVHRYQRSGVKCCHYVTPDDGSRMLFRDLGTYLPSHRIRHITLLHWRRRYKALRKSWYIRTKLHGVILISAIKWMRQVPEILWYFIHETALCQISLFYPDDGCRIFFRNFATIYQTIEVR
jgi:hypothetical protein